MNPPDKLHLFFMDGRILQVGENVGFEYHLAPVWHDAKTDPPKENDQYLVFHKWDGGGEVSRSSFYNGGWMELENPDYIGDTLNVIYWMPLPEPPKESEG